MVVAYQAAGIANTAVGVARDLAPLLVCFEETRELLGKIKGANDQSSPDQLNHNEAGIFHMETLTRHVFIETQLGRVDEGVDFWSDWCTHYILKPRIEREVKKRGEKHVGFPAAVYSFYKELERRSELTDLNDGAIGRNLEALQKRIPKRSKWLGKLKERDFNFGAGELRSLIAMTLEKELTGDPFFLLKKGLEGKLNFVPEAIKNDMIDEIRKSWRTESGKIVLIDGEPGLDTGDEPPAFNQEAFNKWGEEQERSSEDEEQRSRILQIRKAAKNHPDPQVLRCVELLLEGKNQKEIAEILGVSRNTPRNWLKQLRDKVQG